MMGIFGNSSPFDQDVERATSENSTSEEWGLILEVCDRAAASAGAARDCLRAVLRRLAHGDPHVQLAAVTLLDAAAANVGRPFRLEVASRDFETEFRRLLARAQPPVAARLRALLRKWAEGDFKDDPQLDLIPSLYAKLRAESGETPAPAPAAPAPAAAAAAREQEELERAIALSLRDAPAAAPPPAPLYPRVEAEPAPATPRKVRALYDFEAAEDNELTFLAGELVHVTDASDPNWWKGYNERGEGLFPANFVSGDLAAPAESGPSSSAGGAAAEAAGAGAGAGRASPERAAEISEAEMDACLAALHDADPAAPDGGGEEAARRREARVLAMGPLVDAALERADRRHARLSHLSAELVDALNLYHELMRHAPPHHAHHPPPPHHPHPPHLAPPPYAAPR